MHHISSNLHSSLRVYLRGYVLDKNIFALHLHGICYMLAADFAELNYLFG
jgi:hypothetical protein